MALEIFRLVGSVFVDTDKADKSLKKTDKNTEGIGKRLVDVAKTAGKFAGGVIAAAGGAGTAMIALAENTREYRTEQGKLTTAFEDSGFSAGMARAVYQELNGVLGDSGQAVEASNHLAKLCTTTDELADWTTIATGVYATFGDSLPIEGLTEAANETAKTGALTGSLADALNWAGVSEDDFQASLDKCTSEQERQALITDTLNGLYTDAAKAYQENNAEVIAANKAQDNLNATLAKIGGLIDPIVTKGKEVLTKVLTKATPYIEKLAKVVIPWLMNAISTAVDWVDAAIKAFEKFLDWLHDVGDYVGDSLAPILDDLSAAFEYVKDMLEPLIDALKDYFTSGEAAEDATQLVKDAADALAKAYEKLKKWVKDIIQGFKDIKSWGDKNKTALTVLAIAVGTLTTAIIAYNVADAIRNAGGIVYLAQLAATAIGVGALTVAETAHTVATTVATAATTAFSAAVAFLTSPITLVVAAIGALIAIVVLLVKNWDDVKKAASNCWDWIKNTWSKVANWFNTNVIQPVSRFFTNLGTGIKNAFKSAVDGAKNVWSSVSSWFNTKIITPVRNFFSNLGTGIKNAFQSAVNGVKNAWSGVTSWFSNIGSSIKNVFTSAVNGVKNAWSGIKSWFSNLLGGVKTTFSNIVSGIANVFKSPINTIISGINTFIRGINRIQIPSWVPGVGGRGLNISTIPYLAEGAVLEKGQTGFLEGNGAEAVVPLHNNKKWISAVAQDMAQNGIGGGASSQELLEAFLAFVADLPNILSEAFGEMRLDVNKREFARLVKAVN